MYRTALVSIMLMAGMSAPIFAAERFDCGDPDAGISMAISIAPEMSMGDFEGLGRSGLLSPDGQGAWVNPESGIRFIPEQLPPVLYLGSEQFSCTNAAAGQMTNDAVAGTAGETSEQMSTTGNAVELVINQPGRSLGGNLRAGPDTAQQSLGGVAENAPLTIVANTGAHFDGYDWFRVQLGDGRSGYQWGGILCSEGLQLEGVYQTCGLDPTN